MRMTAQQAVEHEQKMDARCPIHYLELRPGCPHCVRIVDEIKTPLDAVELESPLQESIEAECRRRQWPFVRTQMNKATTFTFPGVPDFVIAASGGRVLWIECKSKTGKQTPEQRGFQMLLSRNGHVYSLIRSMREALDLFNNP